MASKNRKNRKRVKRTNGPRGLNPDFTYSSRLYSTMATTVSNGYAKNIILSSISGEIASRIVDSKSINFRKFTLRTFGNADVSSRIRYFIVTAEHGATFTNGAVPYTSSLRAQLDACIDKPFGYTTLPSIEYTDITVAATLHQSKAPKEFNLTAIANKIALAISNPLKTADLPVVWLIGIAQCDPGNIANLKYFFDIDYSYDTSIRTMKNIWA